MAASTPVRERTVRSADHFFLPPGFFASVLPVLAPLGSEPEPEPVLLVEEPLGAELGELLVLLPLGEAVLLPLGEAVLLPLGEAPLPVLEVLAPLGSEPIPPEEGELVEDGEAPVEDGEVEDGELVELLEGSLDIVPDVVLESGLFAGSLLPPHAAPPRASAVRTMK